MLNRSKGAGPNQTRGAEAPRRAGRRRAVRGGACLALVLAGMGIAVAPVVGDGLNERPAPNHPEVLATVPASSAQAAGVPGVAPGAGVSRNTARARRRARARMRVPVLQSRITDTPILTEENKGTYVGVQCPRGAKAISGGVLSQYINLMVSSSSPNNPLTGEYTPRVWWLTVTNVNVDGQGGPLAWRGVANCLTRVRLARG